MDFYRYSLTDSDNTNSRSNNLTSSVLADELEVYKKLQKSKKTENEKKQNATCKSEMFNK